MKDKYTKKKVIDYSKGFPGLQCPACWVGYGDKTESWDTQEHREKYHNGKPTILELLG